MAAIEPEERAKVDFTALFECRCPPRYTIERHGKGYAIYHGRCVHRHGVNVATLTDVARKDFIKHFEDKLNGGN